MPPHSHKLQLTVTDAVLKAAGRLAASEGKKTHEVFRDAISFYLVAKGALQSVEEGYVARGLKGVMASKTEEERIALQERLRERARKAREAQQRNRAARKRAAEAAEKEQLTALQTQAEKMRKLLVK